ncbi:hypothetical protein SUGI_0513690 [Cryptomeria japonica]|nr:hypothetical protein SUGI_0513690 [Cryptomeria japonica]
MALSGGSGGGVGSGSETTSGALPQAEWPEPIQRVQFIAESGITALPPRYIKPENDRPAILDPSTSSEVNIPVIDLGGVRVGERGRERTMQEIAAACKEWGFFQVLNHGVPLELMRRAREVAREFFSLPLEEKQVYANSPKTYEGYGSRLGIDKGAILDWGDYFFLHLLPLSIKDINKWPAKPVLYRETMDEYGKQVALLCEMLLGVLSTNLGLEEDYLQEAFGGKNVGECMRINYYPKCPQPHLTLGLSSHSDPGGMTVLLPDDSVRGLEVRKDGRWILVEPCPHAFIVNIGDQLQILSNGIYKSVEHRVVVNSERDRLSIALFYNPDGNKILFPAPQIVSDESPPLYQPMTFNEYRLFIRTRGPRGKAQVNSITNSTST